MIVVDLGCATYGGADSIGYLIDTYKPSRLYGFDPQGETGHGWGEVVVQGVPCGLRKKAAWTYDGTIGFRMNENGSAVEYGQAEVQCFDLARFVLDLPRVGVLKMDVEGAEYPLLEHLIETGADKRVGRVLVEWHRGVDDALVNALSCPVEEWAM